MTPSNRLAANPVHRMPPGPRLSGLTIVLPCFNEAEGLADAVHPAGWAATSNALEHRGSADSPSASSPSPAAA
jgi:hypothetical protein